MSQSNGNNKVRHTLWSTRIDVSLHKSPIDQGIINEGLQDCHQGFLIRAQHGHGNLAGMPEASFNAAYLQRHIELKNAYSLLHDLPPWHV